MFSVVNACGDKAQLQEYTTGDLRSLIIDCLAVATLVSLVCVVVIGKIDIGLPGPVGTLDNSTIQAMIGASGGVALLDVIAGVVKWNAGRVSTNARSKLMTDWNTRLVEVVTRRYELTGISLTLFKGDPANPTSLLPLRRLIREVCAKEGPFSGDLNAYGCSLEVQRRMENPSALSTQQLEEIADQITLTEISCPLTLENFNKILERWFKAPPVNETEFRESVEWCATLYTASSHPKRSQYLPPNCVADGEHLRDLVLDRIFRQASYRDAAVETEVRRQGFIEKGQAVEEGIRSYLMSLSSGCRL